MRQIIILPPTKLSLFEFIKNILKNRRSFTVQSTQLVSSQLATDEVLVDWLEVVEIIILFYIRLK